MLDWTLVTLTIAAIIGEIIVLFLLFATLSRTRGRIRTSFIYLIVVASLLVIRRTLYLLDIAQISSGTDLSYIDAVLAVLLAIFLILTVYNIYRSVRELTDVELHHTKEARRENQYPPPRREPGEEFERQRERVEEKNVRVDGDGKRRLKVVNGYVDFTNE